LAAQSGSGFQPLRGGWKPPPLFGHSHQKYNFLRGRGRQDKWKAGNFLQAFPLALPPLEEALSALTGKELGGGF